MYNLSLKKRIAQYHTRIKIMSLLCRKSSIYCTKIKNIIVTLIILFSGLMAVITGIYNNTEKIKLPIILSNVMISLLVGFESSFKISERSANFMKHSQSYNKLSHDIDKELNKWSYKNIDNSNDKLIDFLNLTITLYDNITDSITDEFPYNIIKDVKKLYEDLEESYLPLILEKTYYPNLLNTSLDLTESYSSLKLLKNKFLSPKKDKKLSSSLSSNRAHLKPDTIFDDDSNKLNIDVSTNSYVNPMERTHSYLQTIKRINSYTHPIERTNSYLEPIKRTNSYVKAIERTNNYLEPIEKTNTSKSTLLSYNLSDSESKKLEKNSYKDSFDNLSDSESKKLEKYSYKDSFDNLSDSESKKIENEIIEYKSNNDIRIKINNDIV
jgi:hypothetical protein